MMPPLARAFVVVLLCAVLAANASCAHADLGLIGDLGGSGKAEVSSAIRVWRCVLGLDAKPTDITQWDCNLNGVIDMGDVTKLLRCVVGLDAWPIVPPNTGTVIGIAIDDATSAPLSGAVATIGALTSSRTGADGKFTVLDVPAGAQTLGVSRTGYVDASVGVTVTRGKTVDVKQVKLAKVGAVKVFVDPDEITMNAGRQYDRFAAIVQGTSDKRVRWRVVDVDGGTIDASGVYTAPQAKGDFKIKATSEVDPTASGSAIVHVKAGDATVIIE